MSRPVGNKNKTLAQGLLAAVIKRYPNFNPTLEMIKIVQETELKDDGSTGYVQCSKTRYEMWEKLNKYFTPTLKAVEVNAEVKHTGDITINISAIEESKDEGVL